MVTNDMGKYGEYPREWDYIKRQPIKPYGKPTEQVADNADISTADLFSTTVCSQYETDTQYFSTPTLQSIEGLCADINEYIQQLTESVKKYITEEENTNMLPKPQVNNTNNIKGQKQTSKKSFLKVEHLAGISSDNPKRGKIIGVEVQPEGRFSDVLVKVSFGTVNFFYGLKANNPNFERLVNAFSQNENEWVGKEVEFYLEHNDFHDQDFIHCEPVTTSTATKRR